MKSGSRCLYGFSPAVIPRAPEWGDEITVTGYWFLNEGRFWQAPTDLIDFLQSGSPPVFIGFGSMTGRNPDVFTAQVLEALELSRQRGILLTGWGGLQPGDPPDHVFMLDAAPFDWLFPHMAAVVHHCGAGTTAAGMRAGIPTIGVPNFGDQSFWAWRVEALGVGPKTLPRRDFSSRRLASAIKQAVTDREMQQCATELGVLIRAENGVACAVEALQKQFARNKWIG